MNWLILCLALGGALFERLFVLIAVAHSFTTVTEFLLAESLSRRYGSRDVTHLGGLAQASPLLWAASVGGFLVTIGFPGTSLFVAKLAFLVALTQVSGLLCLLCMVLFLLVLPLFFVRLWVPIWFGAHRPTPISGGWHDLGARELLLFSCALGASFALGLAPGLFLTLA
jgi:NADH:ubiquinone oxidoreductase subunit 4 (subunit M)